MEHESTTYYYKASHKRRFKQYVAVFIVNMGAITVGMLYGWSSPALIKLMSEESHIPITANQSSWITSLLMVGGLFGSVLTTLVIDVIGRKWTIVCSSIPFIVSWIMIIFAKNVPMLYAARFIGGLGLGSSYMIVPMYTGEVSEDSVRGALGSLFDTFQSFGILFEYSIGPYVSYYMLAGLSTIIPLLMIILSLMIVPESPYFYLMKERHDEAKKSLQFLRGVEDIDTELKIMEKNVEEEIHQQSGLLSLFTNRGNRRATIIIIGLMGAQQVSGVVALLSYFQLIFDETGGKVPSSISTIGIGVAQFVACIGCTMVSDRFGRRLLLLISTLGSAIFLALTGGFFFTKEVLHKDISSLASIPMTTMILYIVVVNIGLSSQPFVLQSELFPTNIKAKANCVGILFLQLSESVVTKLFEVIMTNVGLYMTFWIFAVCCLISFVFIWVYVFETKGKSLEEIQIELHDRSKKKTHKHETKF